MIFLHVNDAKYIDDYKIEVNFSNGKNGVVDLSDIFNGPIFEPLKDVNLFKQFVVNKELDTIVWPNGADLAPEFLFFKAFKGDSSLAAQFKQWGYIA